MASSVPVLYCVHDDHWYLGPSIRSFKPAGPVTVFVSRVAWDGSQTGDWNKCVEIGEAEGAEVIVGDWPDETIHRRHAQQTLRERAVTKLLIPDGDEIAAPELLRTVLELAKAGLADRVYVHMETYWKSPCYRIRPRERLAPALYIDLSTVEHVHIREYRGGRGLVLGPEYDVLHHMSYAGPDERIKRKMATSSHRPEWVANWWASVWKAWDEDRLLHKLHPTHPAAFDHAERMPVPELLKDAWNERPQLQDPPKPERWPTVSVVIPLYGGEQNIAACLSSLETCAGLIHETVVVDDRSKDSAPDVALKFKGVRLLQNRKNVGFGATCNRGLKESTGEVVIFLNSDTVVPRAGLIRLVECLMASGSVAAAGPQSNRVGYEQPIDVTHEGDRNIDLFAQDLAWRDTDDRDVPMLVGFCLAVRRSALDEVGGFDERFGAGFFEDNDLCARLLVQGFKLRLATRSYVFHRGSETMAREFRAPEILLAKNDRVIREKWREELASGFISHLPGQSPNPIVIRPELHPDQIRKSIRSLAKKVNASLCMIVKNEERCIGECLESARDAFAQIVVVDTGSTDRTKEIAKSRGAEVHDFSWIDSFSAARNESLKHAVHDWIVWTDADDVWSAAAKLRLLEHMLKAEAWLTALIAAVQFPGLGGTRVDHCKAFRNGLGLHFVGRIHEQVIPSINAIGGKIARAHGVVIDHKNQDQSPEGKAAKRELHQKLLRMDYEDDPEHPFFLFNLGMEAHHDGQNEEAVSWLEQSLARCGPNDSILRKVYSLLGSSKRALRDAQGALDIYLQGLAAVGDDPELRFEAAITLSSLGRFAEAKQQYLAINPHIEGHWSSIEMAILGPKRNYNLGQVCLSMENYREAKEWFRQAIQSGSLEGAQALFEEAVNREDFRGAREALELLGRMGGASRPWAEMGARLAAFQGGSQEAFLLDQVRRHPLQSGPLQALVAFLFQTGRRGEAARHLEMLEAMGDADAAVDLSILLVEREEYKEALVHAEAALELDPANERAKKQASALRAYLA